MRAISLANYRLAHNHLKVTTKQENPDTITGSNSFGYAVPVPFPSPLSPEPAPAPAPLPDPSPDFPEPLPCPYPDDYPDPDLFDDDEDERFRGGWLSGLNIQDICAKQVPVVSIPGPVRSWPPGCPCYLGLWICAVCCRSGRDLRGLFCKVRTSPRDGVR